jgi:hypothetical protein
MNLGGLTNGVKFTSGGGISNSFTLPSATGYTFTFPSSNGTIALTSDISYPVTSVFGRTGAVVATSGDYTTAQVTESGNLYYTDTRARLALSFAAGSGAYNSTTGVITIPTNNNQITNGSNYITLGSLSAGVGISYNNTTGVITNSAPDQTVALTASTGISVTGTYPNFTITNTSPSSGGTVTSVAMTVPTGLSVSGSPITTSGTLAVSLASGYSIPTTSSQATWDTAYSLRITTASLPLVLIGNLISMNQATALQNGFLTYTDFTTFNNKQNALTLTTTGTSGAATLVGATLNIPQYTDAYTGTVTSVAALTIGTTGTDLSSTVANSTTTPVITLNVPTASAANRGALSSADWTTFNNKQSAFN